MSGERSESTDTSEMAIQSYRDLDVWKRGMDLAESAYRLTTSFPREEMFGLTSQIRRAATSVPANIAEGWGRDGTNEFRQFLRIAQGSLRELETHLLLAERVGHVAPPDVAPLLEIAATLGRQLITIQPSLSARRSPPTVHRSPP